MEIPEDIRAEMEIGVRQFKSIAGVLPAKIKTGNGKYDGERVLGVPVEYDPSLPKMCSLVSSH